MVENAICRYKTIIGRVLSTRTLVGERVEMQLAWQGIGRGERGLLDCVLLRGAKHQCVSAVMVMLVASGGSPALEW